MNDERPMTYEDTVLGGRILGRHSEEFYTFKEVPRESKRRKE
jgi:hypothetical protein